MATSQPYDYQPVILIGAGRSGTKVIRDVIGTHPELGIIPYDVNYIWRIGQKKDHDALLPSDLDQKKKSIIISQFNKLAKDKPYLLEKTVSNCLRIPFIKAVFPDAKFIFLTRDGRDVVESVMRQWGETRELSYMIAKLRTFPIRHAFAYLLEYMANWVKFKFTKKGNDDYIWGVKYPGYKEDLNTKSILEVCALQWQACIEASTKAMDNLSDDIKCSISYETFVQNPKSELDKIADFLNIEKGLFDSSRIRTNNVSKYKQVFDSSQLQTLMSIIKPGLLKLGYV